MCKYEKDWQILVVDDKKTNLMLAEKILQEEFNVSMAQSGTEAIAFLEKNIVDLVLLDLHMPDMNGFEVMSEIRHNENIPVDLPVIFLTADDDKAMEVRSFKEGAQDFIAKPFVPEIMIQRVRRVIQLDKLQKNLQDEVDKQTRKAEEKKKQFQRLSIQVMQSLAGAIDAKDRYTKGHSQRVAMYSREIAGRYGYDEEKQEAIHTMVSMTDLSEKEAAAELLLEAKGFKNVVVNLTGETADVVIPEAELSDAQRAQIEDIVKRKTGIAPENIVITPLKESEDAEDTTQTDETSADTSYEEDSETSAQPYEDTAIDTTDIYD